MYRAGSGIWRIGQSGLATAPAAGGAWSPLDLGSTLVGWWDFSDAATLFTDAGTTLVASDGDLIYQANDKSGNGKHMVQATEASRPLYKVNVFNGLSAGLFDAVDDLMADNGTTNPRTAFIVARANGYDEDAGLLTPNSGGTLLTRSGASNKWLNTGPIRANGVQTLNIAINAVTIYSLRTTSDITGVYRIANDRSLANRYWADYICERVICDTELSTADQNLLGQYLADKWGLTWTDIT